MLSTTVLFIMSKFWNWIVPPTGPLLFPPSVNVLVYRIPADGSVPCPVRLATTSRGIRIAPDLFPSHIPDVWPFWNDRLNSIGRHWEITKLKEGDSNCIGLYMTIYCFDDESGMQENLHVPQIFQTFSGMYGDVFIAKLAYGQCGMHGWARYEDVRPYFLDKFLNSKTEQARNFKLGT